MRFTSLLLGFTAIFTIESLTISHIGRLEAPDKGRIPIVTNRLRSQAIAKEQPPTTVRFCDLVMHPDSFDDKTIRVRAIYESTWEWKRLYDETCIGPQNYIWPVFNCTTFESCEIFRKSLEKDMVGDPFKGQKVRVTLV